ncbi:MAG: HIT family protein [Chloroflexi bacterium]|nr:HIT family protein [Chloroflexota bacterium]
MRTPNWDVVHAYNTALPGWSVLVLRRHVDAVADLSDDEAAELGPLVQTLSRALRATVGCHKTYVVQFAEHPQHPHVHFHVIPRTSSLEETMRGPGIFALLGVGEQQCVSEPRMNEIALQVRAHLSATC